MALNLSSALTARTFAHGSFDMAFRSYLASAKDVFPHVPQIASGQAAFAGTPAEFLKAQGDNESKFLNQMNNKVKVCPNAGCKKPVAFTLPNCNGCGTDIRNVAIGSTTNIFTSFIYGIQKGNFPFTISVRHADPNILVFDDLLALTPAHFNCIPTDQYIPDWRYLCRKPKEGLVLVNTMFETSWKAMKEQFLQNSAWKNKIFRLADSIPDDDLRAHIACGCNYPPSQYQLHLQFMLPPFTPYHWLLYLNDMHFTKERFFPIEYVRQVLALGIPMDVQETTPIEEVIAFYDAKGVNYAAIWKQCYDNYAASHKRFANWDPQDFEHLAIGNQLFKLEKDQATLVEGVHDLTAIYNNKDKLVLQNYGRPYNEAGKPTGGYYPFAKKEALPETFN